MQGKGTSNIQNTKEEEEEGEENEESQKQARKETKPKLINGQTLNDSKEYKGHCY